MKLFTILLILCLSAICNAELRTWTAVNGKKVEAEFVFNNDGQVTLKMKTGGKQEQATKEAQEKEVRCVFGIEPNEHQIPRFLGKYSYHTDHSENTERPNSSNVLPMSQ